MRPGRLPQCPQAEQSVGWALHALEPAEEVEATAHLSLCASCRELVGQSEELLAMLGSSPQVSFEPPVQLRTELLARIAATPQQPPLPPPAPVHAGPVATPLPRHQRPALQPERPPEPVPDPDRQEPAEPSDGDSARPRRWRIALVAAAVAAVLGIAGLSIRTAQVEQQRDAQISQTQQLAQRLSELQRPGAPSALLSPAGGSPVAAVVVADGVRNVITVGMVPNPSATHTYVLWGTGPDGARALGTFDITDADSGLHRVGSVTGAESFTGYAVSLEPGRVAPASPSLLVASGQVQT